jgi:predicted transcriptional regulator
MAPDAKENLVDEIAAELGADRRTIIKRLAGLPVRGGIGRAIDNALRARGYAPMALAAPTRPRAT